jgi:steroid delta-isomerase-like uncharacterized protein
MSPDNMDASRRVLEEAFNQGNLEVIDEVCSDDFVDHDPLMGDADSEAVKQRIGAYREAFPDIEIRVDEIFAAGDRVVIRWTGTGTFEHPLMGQQPTGERGEPIQGIGIDRFEDGKIAESWGQFDTLQLMRNIGAVPAASAAAAQ